MLPTSNIHVDDVDMTMSQSQHTCNLNVDELLEKITVVINDKFKLLEDKIIHLEDQIKMLVEKQTVIPDQPSVSIDEGAPG